MASKSSAVKEEVCLSFHKASILDLSAGFAAQIESSCAISCSVVSACRYRLIRDQSCSLSLFIEAVYCEKTNIVWITLIQECTIALFSQGYGLDLCCSMQRTTQVLERATHLSLYRFNADIKCAGNLFILETMFATHFKNQPALSW